MSDYVVITPVRNEVDRFPRTIASMVSQTRRPARWVIVDDGSTDGTGAVAEDAAGEHDWIRVLHRPDRGRRLPGTGVMEAFHEGCLLVADLSWEYLAKLDGDLAFAPDYFARCLEHFEKDPRLGIGGGQVCKRVGDRLVVETADDPAFHVRGATKIYRRACWEEIGGLVRAPGWDSIDELKANMLGWHTRTFPDLKIRQLKDTGSADSHWQNWTKNGLANYITGYHPLFLGLKCIKRLFKPPYVIGSVGLAWGYCKGYLLGVAPAAERELIRYVRRQQLNKLLLRPSLW